MAVESRPGALALERRVLLANARHFGGLCREIIAADGGSCYKQFQSSIEEIWFALVATRGADMSYFDMRDGAARFAAIVAKARCRAPIAAAHSPAAASPAREAPQRSEVAPAHADATPRLRSSRGPEHACTLPEWLRAMVRMIPPQRADREGASRRGSRLQRFHASGHLR